MLSTFAISSLQTRIYYQTCFKVRAINMHGLFLLFLLYLDKTNNNLLTMKSITFHKTFFDNYLANNLINWQQFWLDYLLVLNCTNWLLILIIINGRHVLGGRHGKPGIAEAWEYLVEGYSRIISVCVPKCKPSNKPTGTSQMKVSSADVTMMTSGRDLQSWRTSYID